MKYQEQIKKAVQEFYDVTKAFATSRHYTLSYWWIESNFGLDLNDKKIRDDVWEMSSSNDFCDLIQALDFDDVKKEVIVMIWEKGKGAKEMKKYTLENYKEFCDEALICPPFEDEENWQKWIDSHKVQIIANDCVMELDYGADVINEIDFSLREIHNAIFGDGTATTGNTVGGGLRPAELKDIIRMAIQNDYWKVDDFGAYIRDFIINTKDIGDIMRYYEVIQEDYEDATDRCKCDFNKLDMSTMRINPKTIRDAIDSLIGTDRELLYGVNDNNESSDIVFVMDYSLKFSGELIGWFYGEPDDEYIEELIADYKKKLFGEEV